MKSSLAPTAQTGVAARLPRIVPGMAALAARYDVFLVDSYGVLHDGARQYPGAVDCMRELRAVGKVLVLLTNTPRRATTVAGEVATLGVGRDCYDMLISAGELTHAVLSGSRGSSGFEPGQRFFYLGPERSRDIVAGIPFTESASVDDADFMVITGLSPGREAESDYDALLRAARQRELPALCANPDRVAIRAGRMGLCAGALALHYERMGGQVRYLGKPDPAIYAMALERLGGIDHARVAGVGDALATDIAGARNAGLDSVFVAGGIHAAELREAATGDKDGDGVVDEPSLRALFEDRSIAPTFTLARFAW